MNRGQRCVPGKLNQILYVDLRNVVLFYQSSVLIQERETSTSLLGMNAVMCVLEGFLMIFWMPSLSAQPVGPAGGTSQQRTQSSGPSGESLFGAKCFVDACFTDGQFSWEGRALRDCRHCCAVTNLGLVSNRPKQSWEKTQPLPGVVLGEEHQLTEAESLFSCAVPTAHSALFPNWLQALWCCLGHSQGGCCVVLHHLAHGGTQAQGTQPLSVSPHWSLVHHAAQPCHIAAKACPFMWMPPAFYMDKSRSAFLLPLAVVVQHSTPGDTQWLPNCNLHLFLPKCPFVR